MAMHWSNGGAISATPGKLNWLINQRFAIGSYCTIGSPRLCVVQLNCAAFGALFQRLLIGVGPVRRAPVFE
jgi:hypothetical protein